jgi:hypothetical protein
MGQKCCVQICRIRQSIHRDPRPPSSLHTHRDCEEALQLFIKLLLYVTLAMSQKRNIRMQELSIMMQKNKIKIARPSIASDRQPSLLHAHHFDQLYLTVLGGSTILGNTEGAVSLSSRRHLGPSSAGQHPPRTECGGCRHDRLRE